MESDSVDSGRGVIEMSLVSEAFLLFSLLLIIFYFSLPKQHQWKILLVFSLVFYCFGGIENAIYILITAFSAWLCALLIEKTHTEAAAYIKAHKAELSREERSAYKKKKNRLCKLYMVLTLLLNIGILCVFKYSDFVLSQVGRFIPGLPTSLNLLIPLGISFYTFQTIGYVVDVYWEKASAERSFPKLLLFVSFFPQVTQGPISEYRYLAPQLLEGHGFSYQNFSYGCQRMIWGFFKKMVIADTAAPFLKIAYAEYATMNGQNVLLSAFLYSLQIYADFSGYMDIVCGLCQILGIRLTENFDRPYFSKSIAEYWRRWHISLGAWFKTYLYYPIAVSGFAKKAGKQGTKLFGTTFGKTISASIALVVVWFTTGFWHGASWAYIAWGGLNGLFIILSMWMEPIYAKAKNRLHIQETSPLWNGFVVLRTFFLVTLIKVFPEVGSFRDGIGFWYHCFTGWARPDSVLSLIYPVADMKRFLLLLGGAGMMLIVSLMKGKCSVREQLSRWPVVVRYLLFALLVVAIIYCGVPAQQNGGGFLYAQF